MKIDIPNLRIGTSSWSAESWVGSFYPAGTRPADFLPRYAQQFDTVEVDSTFYRIPSKQMVKNWNVRTPAGFLFAAKFPQSITHDKVLVGCEAETREFIETMELLGDKLGALVLQFPYFNREAFARPEDFTRRLSAFLDSLPKEHSYAVEVRNKNWLTKEFTDLVGERGVALALVDQVWMPTIDELAARLDVLTAPFTYIRLIGDRKGIEQKTNTWDKLIVDRSRETQTWVRYVQQFLRRGVTVYIYVNNHFGGSAPASIQLFYETWAALDGSVVPDGRLENGSPGDDRFWSQP